METTNLDFWKDFLSELILTSEPDDNMPIEGYHPDYIPGYPEFMREAWLKAHPIYVPISAKELNSRQN